MSSSPLSRIGIRVACVPVLLLEAPLIAQENQMDAEIVPPPPVRQPIDIGEPEEIEDLDAIDLLFEAPEGEVDQRRVERCEREREAATISGEIVVCRQFSKEGNGGFDKEKWEREYAERTQGQKPVNVDGEGITGRHLSPGKTIGGLCVIPPCPPPAALIIDVTALPEAPPGSDADRIARGLPPRGNDQGDPISQDELLGVAANAPDSANDKIRQEGSAAPAAGQ